MSGDGVDDIHISSLLISRENGEILKTLIVNHGSARVKLSSKPESQEVHNTLDSSSTAHHEQPTQSNQSSP